MKHVTINFADGDCLGCDVLDMVVNNGFVTLFLPEDDFGNKTVQAYNMRVVDDFEFVQNDEGEDDEGVSD